MIKKALLVGGVAAAYFGLSQQALAADAKAKTKPGSGQGAPTQIVITATRADGPDPVSYILRYGQFRAEVGTSLSLKLIESMNPQLHAVIALNPHALADARALDAERKAGKVRGPLHLSLIHI